MNSTSTFATVANFDLRQLIEEDPMTVSDLLTEATQLWASLTMEIKKPTGLIERYPIGEVSKAFEYLEGRQHLGHTVVWSEPTSSVPIQVDSVKSLRESIDPKKTYLLAGGLGGLGRSIANLLIANGARHLAFLTKSETTLRSSEPFLSSLTERRIQSKTFVVDICDKDMLYTILREDLPSSMPPVGGVFQCAAVIRDAVFENMTWSDWTTAFRPKTTGSWNLVESYQDDESSPFFIFLASSAGVIGNRGQANYAAGNHFQDSLAEYCRLKGRHAVSIDLGPILEAGMLSDDEEMLDKLKASGFYGIRFQDFITVIKHAITGEILPGVGTPAQIAMGVGTGGLILQNQPADPYWSRTALYRYLNLVDMPPVDLSVVGSGDQEHDVKTMLARCSDKGAAAAIITTGLSHMLAKSLNLLPEEVSSSKTPTAYGVDSLVAVGVRNWIYTNFNVNVSVFEVLSEYSITELGYAIAERAGFND